MPARAEGYLKVSPMPDVEKPKIERGKKGRALKPDEIQSILEQCREPLRPYVPDCLIDRDAAWRNARTLVGGL